MRQAFVGFDSAWADRSPGGIACATFEEGRPQVSLGPKLVHFGEANRVIERLRDQCDYVLVAIDQPTLVPNETGMRPVERVATSLISRLRGGVQPAYRRKTSLFGPEAPIWKFLDSLGARENPPAARTAKDGLHLIEVFPALALPAMEPWILERGRAARYNPQKRKRFCLSDWKLVASAVERHARDADLAPLSRWAGKMTELAAPRKGDQDLLDAAICLFIALHWRQAPRYSSAVVGDSRTGYVVTPVSPASRNILKKAADKKQVQIDGPWPRDVDRSSQIYTAGTEFYREIRMKPSALVPEVSSPSGGGEYPCPIPVCSKVFHGSRGGWDAHVASFRRHPAWHPDVSNPEERKQIFKHEYADWFHTPHASSAEF